MKNKKILTTGISLALVGIIGAGATLAYLTDKTGPVENTFTIGKGYITDENSPALVLDETALGNAKVNSNFNGRTTTGNSYEFIPGGESTKDPDVHLRTDSISSYVFVNVVGLDEMLNGKDGVQYYTGVDFNTENWIKTSANQGYDGTYVYSINGKDPLIVNKTSRLDVENDDHEIQYYNLQNVFTKLELNNGIESLPNDEIKLSSVEIKACAVQADNIEYSDALKLANAKFVE